MTKSLIGFLLGLILSICFFLALLPRARADEPSVPGDPSHVEIPGERFAGPEDFATFKPVLWIGVKAGGEYVVWLVFDDHISVIDKDHRPKDWKGFLHDLEASKIPSDERVIACTSSDL
jgi:hypothetical protein